MKPSGLNLLDKPLEGFIVILADLPRKGVKMLATSGRRVNHDSWVKMYDLCRVFLLNWYTSRAHGQKRLGNSYIKGDDSCCVKILIVYCLMLCIIYVTLIAILVEFDMDSLLLFPPHLRRSIGLVIN